MTSEQNNLTFYLNILEVPGKAIVNTYVNDIHLHLDKRGLKHTVDIITDEDFYVNNTITGGKNTFPYNHFEEALNSMRDVLPFTGTTNTSENTVPIPDTNYDDETVTTEIKEEDKNKQSSTNTLTDTLTENTLVTSMLSYNPLELDDTTNNSKHTQSKSKNVVLDIPDNYTGIIHILLTINVKPSTEFISGGITQLNQFLETYNKKGDLVI